MTIKQIRNEEDYQRALARLELIFDAKKGSMASDELGKLAELIDLYENERHCIDPPNLHIERPPNSIR